MLTFIGVTIECVHLAMIDEHAILRCVTIGATNRIVDVCALTLTVHVLGSIVLSVRCSLHRMWTQCNSCDCNICQNYDCISEKL